MGGSGSRPRAKPEAAGLTAPLTMQRGGLTGGPPLGKRSTNSAGQGATGRPVPATHQPSRPGKGPAHRDLRFHETYGLSRCQHEGPKEKVSEWNSVGIHKNRSSFDLYDGSRSHSDLRIILDMSKLFSIFLLYGGARFYLPSTVVGCFLVSSRTYKLGTSYQRWA